MPEDQELIQISMSRKEVLCLADALKKVTAIKFEEVSSIYKVAVLAIDTLEMSVLDGMANRVTGERDILHKVHKKLIVSLQGDEEGSQET